MNLLPLPTLTDNYVWILHGERDAIAVDPGDSVPVLQALHTLGLKLQAILVTHHHPDHVDGIDTLRDTTGARIYGPARESIPMPFTRLHGGDAIDALGMRWDILDVPGHTAGHIAFYSADADGQPLLFCGDTLFSGGCGRLFEGTPAQMLHSLDQLAALPGNTRVCCAHEYTLSNLVFARTVEPTNQPLLHYMDLCRSKRAHQQPTLPSTIAMELQINPFLRVRRPDVAAAVHQYNPQTALGDPVAVFAALRQWKNNFS